ncbi:unnamed protein product [Schistosoma margrebowiei]|uniref:Uncharacterized protein n=1 Tax=Schistosoma margrebowiei TaxID=48269 RepID=A0A183N0I6_9TREM|nr:unnamed protein product [Schistosoma margrebowiei]
MKTSTSEGKRGKQWTSRMQLNDLDFADDLALLSHMHQQMQKRTTSVAPTLAAVCLNIHKGKNKILRYNTACTITSDGEDLEDVKSFTYLGRIIDKQDGSDAEVTALTFLKNEQCSSVTHRYYELPNTSEYFFLVIGEALGNVKTFTYLDSIIDEHGGSDADVKARIGKARAAFPQPKNIWNSKQLATNTKVRIFNTNVKTVLLYGAEILRTTKAIIQKIQVFIDSCLRKILRIR